MKKIQKRGPGIMIASLENTNVVAEIMNHGLTVQNTDHSERVMQTAGQQDTIKVAKENRGLMRNLDTTKTRVLMTITVTVGNMMNTTIISRPDIQSKYHRHRIVNTNLNLLSNLYQFQNLDWNKCHLSVLDLCPNFLRQMR